MIDTETIREILSLYDKHGWTISRVLLSGLLRTNLGPEETAELFHGTEIEDAEFDAVWFKRPRDDGRIAWEIRLLSEKPYALCESYPDTTGPEDVLAGMKIMENRLTDQAS